MVGTFRRLLEESESWYYTDIDNIDGSGFTFVMTLYWKGRGPDAEPAPPEPVLQTS